MQQIIDIQPYHDTFIHTLTIDIHTTQYTHKNVHTHVTVNTLHYCVVCTYLMTITMTVIVITTTAAVPPTTPPMIPPMLLSSSASSGSLVTAT